MGNNHNLKMWICSWTTIATCCSLQGEASIYIYPGQSMDHQMPTTQQVSQDGWSKQTLEAGSPNASCQLLQTLLQRALSFCFWMAITLILGLNLYRWPNSIKSTHSVYHPTQVTSSNRWMWECMVP